MLLNKETDRTLLHKPLELFIEKCFVEIQAIYIEYA